MKNFILPIISLFVIISCEKAPCKNGNAIFDSNAPESKAYQDELVKQLQNTAKKNLTYTLEKYVEAVVKVVIFDSKLEEIRKTKGQGYYGAELKNLQFQIFQDSLKTELIYESFENSID